LDHNQEHDLQRSQSADFERHFVKPLAIDKLLRAIDQ